MSTDLKKKCSGYLKNDIKNRQRNGKRFFSHCFKRSENCKRMQERERENQKFLT